MADRSGNIQTPKDEPVLEGSTAAAAAAAGKRRFFN